MASTTWPATLQQAIVCFSDPETAFQEIVRFRWPDGVVRCPTCGSKDVYFTPSRRIWQCKNSHPKRQFSVKVGSIMEDSAIGIDKWLIAMWLIASAKNGISSYELARSIGVTQKSAWFMLHRIRLAMQDEGGGKVGGHIEADETYIGGKARNMHHARRKRIITGTGGMGKIAVMGLLARHGKDGHSTVRVAVVPDNRKSTLQGRVRQYVRKGAHVYTDELLSYDGLDQDYIHKVIDHAERYVDGQIHTNGCENFWSLLKRALKGTYVSVEPFHLFRYLDEQAFRFNSRKLTDAARFALTAASVFGKRLTFNALTGRDLPETC
ncbi:MAG: IS1595 family transposase [Vicinamibacterales bacterium]